MNRNRAFNLLNKHVGRLMMGGMDLRDLPDSCTLCNALDTLEEFSEHDPEVPDLLSEFAEEIVREECPGLLD